MILMPQIFDVIANENACYERNDLEYLFMPFSIDDKCFLQMHTVPRTGYVKPETPSRSLEEAAQIQGVNPLYEYQKAQGRVWPWAGTIGYCKHGNVCIGVFRNFLLIAKISPT